MNTTCAIWELPHAAGRVSMRCTRLHVTRRRVAVVGPVPLEPSMVRVRTSDGEVHRAMREHVHPVENDRPRQEQAA